MEQRNHLRIYDLLRRLGHTGTENEMTERIMAAAAGVGVRADVVTADYECSAPRGSTEWRQNRAKVTSTIIVGCITRVGRVACIMSDAVGVPCEVGALLFSLRAARSGGERDGGIDSRTTGRRNRSIRM